MCYFYFAVTKVFLQRVRKRYDDFAVNVGTVPYIRTVGRSYSTNLKSDIYVDSNVLLRKDVVDSCNQLRL